jgi:hypothetical protein
MGSYDIIIYSDSETYTRTVKDLLEQQEAETPSTANLTFSLVEVRRKSGP